MTEGKHCSRCNEVLVKQETVKALGHVEVADEAVEATCTNVGKTAGKHCSRCNEVLVKQETVKALGHKNKNGICLTCNEDISTKGLEYLDGADENTLILAGMGAAIDEDIIIPSAYNGKKIVSIGESCFRENTNIFSVDIPDSVTSIGIEAFWNCSRLTSVTIGNGVTSIGREALRYCNELENIYITDLTAWCKISGLNNLMDYGPNNKKLYLNNELITKLVIPDSVTSIGEYAFV